MNIIVLQKTFWISLVSCREGNITTKNSGWRFFFYVKSPPRTLWSQLYIYMVVVVFFVGYILKRVYIYIFFFFEDGFFVVRRCNVAHDVRRGPTGSIFQPPRQRMTVDPVRDVAGLLLAARNTRQHRRQSHVAQLTRKTTT